MLPSDMYSQPNAVDPVLDARTMLDLVRRHGVRCSAVTSIDETGGEARAYGLDDNLVLKVKGPIACAPDQFGKGGVLPASACRISRHCGPTRAWIRQA